jgi:hypothetical protein
MKDGHTDISCTLSYFVVATHEGRISIPPAIAITNNDDTLYSNKVVLTVKKGTKPIPKPELDIDDLYPTGDAFDDIGGSYKKDIENSFTLTEEFRKSPEKYLVGAGLIYHSIYSEETRKSDIGKIDQLLKKIKALLEKKAPSTYLGIYMYSHEPVCYFTVNDTTGLSAELNKLYGSVTGLKEPDMVYGTLIVSKDQFISYTSIADLHAPANTWQEVDTIEKALAKEKDEITKTRLVYVRVAFQSPNEMDRFGNWAEKNGYSIFRKEQSNESLHYEMVVTSKANALPHTLFDISNEIRNGLRKFSDGRYLHMGIDTSAK